MGSLSLRAKCSSVFIEARVRIEPEASSCENRGITALRRGSSDSLNQTGQKVVQQNLNIQPTLTVRPGFPVRVIVNRDLVLEPYKG